MRSRTCSSALTRACGRAIASWPCGRGCTGSPTTAASTSSGGPAPPPPELLEIVRAAGARPDRRGRPARVAAAPDRRRPAAPRAAALRAADARARRDGLRRHGFRARRHGPGGQVAAGTCAGELAQALEARDTACSEIREELTLAHDRGVRPTARPAATCATAPAAASFRRELRGVSRRFAALVADARTARRARQAPRVRWRRRRRRGCQRRRRRRRRRGRDRRRALRRSGLFARRCRARRDVDRGGGGDGRRGSRDPALDRRCAAASPPPRVGAGGIAARVRTGGDARHRRCCRAVACTRGVAGRCRAEPPTGGCRRRSPVQVKPAVHPGQAAGNPSTTRHHQRSPRRGPEAQSTPAAAPVRARASSGDGRRHSDHAAGRGNGKSDRRRARSGTTDPTTGSSQPTHHEPSDGNGAPQSSSSVPPSSTSTSTPRIDASKHRYSEHLE